MTQKNLEKIIFTLIPILILILSCALFPNTFKKMFLENPNPGFGDTTYYIGIAEDGYNTEPEWAYYPLYPITIKITKSITSLPSERISVIVSMIFFLVSVPITLKVFSILLDNKTYLPYLLLYLTNPMIIFHYLGYTESLFSLLLITTILVIITYDNSLKKMLILVFLSALLSLTRPVLPQIIASSILPLLVATTKNKQIKESLFISFPIIIGSMIGYSLFGIYALISTGNFFKPFSVQSLWDKKIGIYISNLWAKGTTLDIIALYLGIFVIIYLIIKRLEVLSTTEYKKEFIFWFSLGIMLSHILIVFLTQNGDLRSLGRYVFSIPTTFLALGIIFNVKKGILPYTLITISLIALLYWFYLYSETLWIG